MRGPYLSLADKVFTFAPQPSVSDIIVQITSGELCDNMGSSISICSILIVHILCVNVYGCVSDILKCLFCIFYVYL